LCPHLTCQLPFVKLLRLFCVCFFGWLAGRACCVLRCAEASCERRWLSANSRLSSAWLRTAVTGLDMVRVDMAASLVSGFIAASSPFAAPSPSAVSLPSVVSPPAVPAVSPDRQSSLVRLQMSTVVPDEMQASHWRLQSTSTASELARGTPVTGATIVFPVHCARHDSGDSACHVAPCQPCMQECALTRGDNPAAAHIKVVELLKAVKSHPAVSPHDFVWESHSHPDDTGAGFTGTTGGTTLLVHCARHDSGDSACHVAPCQPCMQECALTRGDSPAAAHIKVVELLKAVKSHPAVSPHDFVWESHSHPRSGMLGLRVASCGKTAAGGSFSSADE